MAVSGCFYKLGVQWVLGCPVKSRTVLVSILGPLIFLETPILLASGIQLGGVQRDDVLVEDKRAAGWQIFMNNVQPGAQTFTWLVLSRE